MNMKRGAYGFTIVELLIVIVVIAILATISVVAYSGIQNMTNDTAVQSDLAKFAKKVELYNAEYGTYPANGTQLTAAVKGFSPTKSAYDLSYYTFTYRVAIDRNEYVIAGKSKSGKIWYKSSKGGGRASISSTYGGFVGGLIGISDPAGEPVYGTYGYASNTGLWASWTNG